MPKYDVHVYAAVHFSVRSVEAESPTKATEIVEASYNLPDLIAKGEVVDDENAPLGFIVDPLDEEGEIIFDETAYIPGRGASSYL